MVDVELKVLELDVVELEVLEDVALAELDDCPELALEVVSLEPDVEAVVCEPLEVTEELGVLVTFDEDCVVLVEVVLG